MPKFLKALIIVPFLALPPLSPNPSSLPFEKKPVLEINLYYKDQTVTLTSINKGEGYVPDYLNQPQEGYSAVIFDDKNSELFKVKFNFPLQVISEDFTDPAQPKSTIQTLTEADTTVTIPAFENATRLLVFDPQGQILVDHNLSVIVDPNLAQRGATPTFGFIFNWLPWLGLLALLGLLLILVLSPYLLRWWRKRTSQDAG